MSTTIIWTIWTLRTRFGKKISEIFLEGTQIVTNNNIVHLRVFICTYHLYYRASPKKENKSVSSFASTSFDDFQESVSDAWEIDAEDEILRISGND